MVEVAGAMLMILAAIDLADIVLAAHARLPFRSPRALRLSNPMSATILGGVAAPLATQ